MKYYQCEITHEQSKIVCYLPDKYSFKGMHIRVDGLEGRWRVNKVFFPIDSSEINRESRKYKIQRKASDI
jgi:hypothetical protein